MGEILELDAKDGHKFSAYKATPDGKPKGGVVIVQEIFGVNSHIRNVCDGYAARGFVAIAPALFDRIRPDITLDYESADVEQGIKYKMQIEDDNALADIDAAAKEIADAGDVTVIGYCWGGTLAWLCATRLGVDCAVGYYGSSTIDFIDEAPACPVTLMLGEADKTFPSGNIAAIRKAHPEVTVFTYPAGHGFACDQRGAWHAASAHHARERTLAVFNRYLG